MCNNINLEEVLALIPEVPGKTGKIMPPPWFNSRYLHYEVLSVKIQLHLQVNICEFKALQI